MQRAQRGGQPSIQLPNAVDVVVQMKDGPWAAPAVAAIALPGQVKILAIGGLSKQQHIAAPIYANMLAGMTLEEMSSRENRLAVASLALVAAQDLLDASVPAQQPPAAAPPPSPIITG